MILIEHIRVEDFRGIREIDLDLNGKTFVVVGPNGSGKSGIVDAIDFALTGNVRRLSGEGRGLLSVAEHAPHVYSRSTPTSAVVALTVTDVASGKSAVLNRGVANPRSLRLTPNIPEVRSAIQQSGAHPELTLTRNELLNLVISTPAMRAEGIQKLLQLDRLGEFRRRLQTARNKADQSKTNTRGNVANSEGSLATHIGAAEYDEAALLSAVNERRRVLGAPELVAVESKTDFLEGVTLEAGRRGIALATAIAETHALTQRVADMSPLDSLREGVLAAIAKLEEKPGLREAISRQGLLSAGLGAVTSEVCPLCGLEWPDANALRAHIQAEIDRATEAQELLQAVTAAGDSYRSELHSLRHAIGQVVEPARTHGRSGLAAQLDGWLTSISQHIGLLNSVSTIIAAADEFTVRKYDAPEGALADVGTLEDTMKALPDLSDATDARDFLAVAKERWVSMVAHREALEKGAAEANLASTVYESYATVLDQVLEDLYEKVERDFSTFYRFINSDDEGSFRAHFTPSQGRLDLSVDFYGIGKFPPNAYHSDGHQDGMGVCLYLALMKRILGADFRLSILDDVLVSVDAGHRKQFCGLLKTEFPNVQFIITTHDEVWARHMESEGLITRKQRARFYGWTVDGGPLFEQGDFRDRIEEDLGRSDVNGAAHKLRRSLEAAMRDIAEAIGGKVAYRGDARYELGELIDAVNATHGELLRKAGAAANSWNNDLAKGAVREKQQARSDALQEAQSELWVVNTLVHNNDWAQMVEADFRPVLEAVEKYLCIFTCDNPACTGWIHVDGRPPETLRCDCGNYLLSLKVRGT